MHKSRILACLMVALSCGVWPGSGFGGSPVKKQSFGNVPDQGETLLYICHNAHGLEMRVTDYGARLVALSVPDRQGKLANVTLGFDSVSGYVRHTAYFGCTTGRYANRIGQGKFMLDGREYTLARNNGNHSLHGGKTGFDRVIWKSTEVSQTGASGVRFTHVSPNGDEGYPGELTTAVTYWLTDENELKIEYEATTNSPTVLNLTNHAYWNLGGAESGRDILGHILHLAADEFLAVGEGMIPTGEKTKTAGTFMDFATPKPIGSRIAEADRTFAPPGGYDHCYVLRKGSPGALALAARVEDPASGRVMEVRTTEPAVQFYSANFLDGSATNGGYKQRAAFCLETQHYPDSPNQPAFPSTVLRPGQNYRQTTIHKFLIAPAN